MDIRAINNTTNQEKIVILHMIETSGPGGAENVLIKLVQNLDRKRFLSIVCLRKSGWLSQELSRIEIETHIIPESGRFDFFFLWQLVSLIKKRKISLIHAHEFLMNAYGTLAGLITGHPAITTVHGKYYYWEKWYRRAAMRLASRYSRMISVSQELRLFLEKSVGISPQRILTIYNGIELRRGDALNNTALARSELQIDAESQVIGTIANLYPVKGHTYLIRAIPKIVKQFPKVLFIFLGRGDEEQKLRQEAEELGVGDYVRFFGFRSDARDILHIMDLFVLPSLSECLPLSVLEAMEAGIAPVVTNVGGNSEVIDDSYNGYIVAPTNSEALAEKIMILLSNRELANTMGSNAKRTIAEKFSLKKMVDEYQTLYFTLLNK